MHICILLPLSFSPTCVWCYISFAVPLLLSHTLSLTLFYRHTQKQTHTFANTHFTSTHTLTNTRFLSVWESPSVICIVFHFSNTLLVLVSGKSLAPNIFLRISRIVNKHLEKDDEFPVNSVCTLEQLFFNSKLYSVFPLKKCLFIVVCSKKTAKY